MAPYVMGDLDFKQLVADGDLEMLVVGVTLRHSDTD
jgi:hypothetical protein